ncbi:MAG: hypothetical protein H6Q09_529, partial [Acidobacteria bacterium]|nr:hypothetical protein [Acidobacteriota bacterium]
MRRRTALAFLVAAAVGTVPVAGLAQPVMPARGEAVERPELQQLRERAERRFQVIE